MDNREKKLKIHAKTRKKRMAVFVQNFAGGTERNSLHFPSLFLCPFDFESFIQPLDKYPLGVYTENTRMGYVMRKERVRNGTRLLS